MPRLDRLLTLYLFRPLLETFGRRETQVPILMYHSVSEISSPERHPYFEIRTSPSMFRSQMSWLDHEGFTTLFPSEISPWLASPQPNSSRAVCLTFDDGYEDFLKEAYPVLSEFGFKSTVYVPTGLVGSQSLSKLKLLSWPQIKRLSSAGVNIGSHSRSHPEMKALKKSEIIRELAESRHALEDALSREVCDFSHPFAFPEFDAHYMAMYREALLNSGYRSAVTTIIGTTDSRHNDPLLLKRIPVNNWDDRRFFLAKLNNAYSWLHPVQSFYKTVRNLS